MKKVTYGIIVGILTLISVNIYAGEGSWLTDFEKAKTEAKKKSLPILVDFAGSDWCGWCIKLDKEVFSKKKFKKYAKDNVILFLADFPSKKKQTEKVVEQNKILAEKYNIRGFPTVLLLDAKGTVIARTGYRAGGVSKYIKHIKTLIK